MGYFICAFHVQHFGKPRQSPGYKLLRTTKRAKGLVFSGFCRFEMEQFYTEIGFYVNVEGKIDPLI